MTSRRAVLELAAAAGALAGIGGVAAGQSADVELDGRASGWVGRSPAGVADEVNPTLALEPGRTYRVTWTNVDGAPHNFTVSDADGDRLVRSDVMDEQGAAQTVEFEATPAMTEYRCEIHPSSMRGQMAVGGEGAENETAGNETAGNETTPEDQGPPPVLDAGTIVLGGLSPHWLGMAPSGLRGRENPTLRLRAGAEYELVWMNLDGVEHDFHLIDSGGNSLADTSSREDVGDTHSTSFEATAAMAQYVCEFHPQSMRGGVEIV